MRSSGQIWISIFAALAFSACASQQHKRLSNEELVNIAFSAAKREGAARNGRPLEGYKTDVTQQVMVRFSAIPYFKDEAVVLGGFDVFVDPFTGKVNDMKGQQ